MSRDKALQIARLVAEKEGWPWTEPVEAAARRRFPFVGRRYWQVKTDYKFRTRGVQVEIDGTTGQVLRVLYQPY